MAMNNRKSNGIVRGEKNLLHDSRIDSGKRFVFLLLLLLLFHLVFDIPNDAIYILYDDKVHNDAK